MIKYWYGGEHVPPPPPHNPHISQTWMEHSVTNRATHIPLEFSTTILPMPLIWRIRFLSLSGYMATHLGTDIKNVVSTGAGLSFVVYPEAVAQMPGSTLWAILFFLMLLALGLDTLLVYVVTIVTAIMDEYPKLLYKWRLLVLCSVCAALYVGGLPLITQVVTINHLTLMKKEESTWLNWSINAGCY